MPVLTEKYIEDKVVDYAEECGCLCVKLNLQGNRGYTDRIVTLPNGGVLWIEFKRKGKKPRPYQDYVHDELRKRNQIVAVIDSIESGKELIDECLGAETLPRESA